jgi:hypothetical protein
MLSRGLLRPFASTVVVFLAVIGWTATAPPASSLTLLSAPDSVAGGGTGVTAASPETTKSAPHRVLITRDYYASLCWYGLGQLGFGGREFNPDYAEYASKLDLMVGDLGFRAPSVKGPMLQLIYQMPAYFNPESPAEMSELFGAMKRFIKSGSLDEFRKKWPRESARLEEWFPGNARGYFEKTLGSHEDVVGQALDVWEQYMEALWPKYRADYEAKLKGYPFEKYESQCESLGAFKFWRREFGVDYPYADFILVICPENPTLASSIGPDKVLFGAMHTWTDMRNAVAHEIGVRYPSLSLLYENRTMSAIMATDYDDVLRLVQVEVCFRTPKILPGLKRDSFVSGMRLERLLAWRAKQEAAGGLEGPASAGPAELLLELYVRAKKDGVL